MIKIKKALAFLLSILLLLSVCFVVVGCSEKRVKIKLTYYEVKEVGKNINTISDALGEIIFDEDTNELYIEHKYDGKEYAYFPEEYLDPIYVSRESGGWTSIPVRHISLWKEGEEDIARYSICEKGNYCYIFVLIGENYERYTYWGTRILRLHIAVL